MADVFISYAREDRARAEQVARGLEALGLEAFWDTDIPPGQTWADYIEGKLAACKAVVVLWSEHSTKSQWVREEARMGRDKSKLIPALIDGSQMPFGFGEVQAANLSSWNGDLNNAEWTRFANAVHAAARDGAAAPAARPPAPSTPYRPLPVPPAAPAYAAGQNGGVEKLSPIGYIQKCFRLYANGKGRARRSEYGWFIVFQVVCAIIAMAVDASVFGFNTYTSTPNGYLATWLLLGLIAPSISVASRRCHDFGTNGWLAALTVIPYIGWLVALVYLFIPSNPGENQYGPNPKGQ
jgi:uncharacterized membrane protein YhaH (DUF805 family)